MNQKKTYESIQTIFHEFNEIVIKKDGLCGGKGVTVQGYDFFDKDEQINSILESKIRMLLKKNSLEKNFPF